MRKLIGPFLEGAIKFTLSMLACVIFIFIYDIFEIKSL